MHSNESYVWATLLQTSHAIWTASRQEEARTSVKDSTGSVLITRSRVAGLSCTSMDVVRLAHLIRGWHRLVLSLFQMMMYNPRCLLAVPASFLQQ